MQLEETYTFSGAGCIFSVTASQTVEVGGIAYSAIPQTFGPQPTPVPVIFQYPSLTLTVITSVGPTLHFVCFPLASLINRLKHGEAIATSPVVVEVQRIR